MRAPIATPALFLVICATQACDRAKPTPQPHAQPSTVVIPSASARSELQKLDPQQDSVADESSAEPRTPPPPAPRNLSPEEWLAAAAAAAWSGQRDRTWAQSHEAQSVASEEGPAEVDSGAAAPEPSAIVATIQPSPSATAMQPTASAAATEPAASAASTPAAPPTASPPQRVAAARSYDKPDVTERWAAFYGAGPGFTGVGAGASGFTGIGAGGEGFTGFGATRLPDSPPAAGSEAPQPSVVVMPIVMYPWGMPYLLY